MPSIEGSGFPLVFKVREGVAPTLADAARFRTEVRSLEGMQKEAVVTCDAGGVSWRLVSDEGPYLNGKDMAPFPLAFFTAGMQFSFLTGFLRRARAQGIPLEALSLAQDNLYSMEGSFLRGDARGGAMPAELRLRVQTVAPASEVAALARAAAADSPAESLMRTALESTFALTLNGRRLSIPDVASSPSANEADPAASFEALAPAWGSFLPDIITRVKQAEAIVGVEGGAGSSLKAEQRRTLHVHGEARWIGEMLMETLIDLEKPIGSSYRFLCDETEDFGGRAGAPPPLAYLTAGIGFCFMTQLGRYAHISKQELDAYRIVQKNVFRYGDGTRPAEIEPVDTEVFLDARFAEADGATKLVRMGRQTCFLHAAMRGEHESRILLEVNGTELA